MNLYFKVFDMYFDFVKHKPITLSGMGFLLRVRNYTNLRK